MQKITDTTDSVFLGCYETLKEIPFNVEWQNKTGYFDHAVKGEHAPVLGVGEMVRSVSNAGRKIIMIGTPIGNVVVFRRYTEEDGIYTYNAPQNFEVLTCHTMCARLTESNLHTLFGECYKGFWIRGNIGLLIQEMKQILN